MVLRSANLSVHFFNAHIQVCDCCLTCQTIPYTDSPIGEITLYACWDGDHWVTKLPSDY